MSNVRILLRTKTSGPVVVNDLSSREFIFGNTEKNMYYRDTTGALFAFMPKSDTVSSYTTWDSSTIYSMILSFSNPTAAVTDHNILLSLQGGQTNNYYHLNLADYNNVTTYLLDGSSTTLHTHDHSNTTNLQGGQASQYYHLDASRYADISSLVSRLAINLHLHDHSTTSNLQGGQASQYYHLNAADYTSASIYLTDGCTTALHTHDHCSLANKQGGQTGQYYHLDATRYADVSSMVSRTSVTMHTHDHCSLANKQGGQSGEYYHLTSSQAIDITSFTNGSVIPGTKHSHLKYIQLPANACIPDYGSTGVDLPTVDVNTTWYTQFNSLNVGAVWQILLPTQDFSGFKEIHIAGSDTAGGNRSFKMDFYTYTSSDSSYLTTGRVADSSMTTGTVTYTNTNLKVHDITSVFLNASYSGRMAKIRFYCNTAINGGNFKLYNITLAY